MSVFLEDKALSSESLYKVLFKRYYPLTARSKGIVLDDHERAFLDASLFEVLRANHLYLFGEKVNTSHLDQAMLITDVLKCIEKVVLEQYDPFTNPQLQKVLTLCDIVRVYETSKTQYAIDMHTIKPFKNENNNQPEKANLYHFQSLAKTYTCKLLFSHNDFKNNELDLIVKNFEVLVLRGQQTVHDAVLRAIVRSRANYRVIKAKSSRSDTLRDILRTFSSTLDKDFTPINLAPEFCLAPINLKLFYDKYLEHNDHIDRSFIHFSNYFDDKLSVLYDNSLLSITREYFGKQHCTDAYFITKNSIILEARENAFLPRITAELVEGDLILTSELRLGVHVPEHNKIIRVTHNVEDDQRFLVS